MHYGIWTSYFIEYSPEDAVKLFSSKGWRNLELSDEHASMLLDRGKSESEGIKFRKYAEDFGVSFLQGHLSLRADIVDDEEMEIINTLKKWLDLFLALNIKAAVLHPGGMQARQRGMCNEEIRERQVRVLRQLADYIKDTDMIICLENIPKSEPYAEDLIDIIEACSCSKLGICLDTGHLNICDGDQEDFILKSDKHLKALHIADNEGNRDQHMMPYGKGNVNWDKVIKGLAQINYKGLFNLEIPGERSCPFEIKMAKLDYLKSMVSYMINEYHKYNN